MNFKNKKCLEVFFRCLFCFAVIYICVVSAGRPKKKSSVYKVIKAWDTGFQARVRFKVLKRINNGWKFTFRFKEHLARFECWAGILQSTDVDESRSDFIVTNTSYNGRLFKSSRFQLEFIGHFLPDVVKPKPPPVTIIFQNRLIYSGPQLSVKTTPSPITVTTTDIMFVLNSILQSNQPGSAAKSNIPDRIDFSNDIVEEYQDDEGNQDVSGTRNNQTISKGKNDFNLNMTNEDINRRNQEINSKNEWLNKENNSSLNSTTIDRGVENNIKQSTKLSKQSTTPTQRTFSKPSINLKPSTRVPPTTTMPKPTPVQNITTKYDYKKILHKSLLFYEAQRSGKLPPNKRIQWTVSSALNDRGENGEDLTGGYYDAGDYVKFGFPMAFSITMLAWGVIEYWDAYEATGELTYALDALRWGADYFMKAHVSPFELYGQVGNPEKEHHVWGRPETIPGRRPAYSINKKRPGSDLAGETSAALAAVAVAMRKAANGRVTPYIGELVRHSHELYTFAKNFQQKYHLSIKEAEKYYKSTNFKDEIAWASAWLYRATGEEKFLKFAEGQYQNWALFVFPKHLRFSWDDKRVGLQMLLAQISTIYTRRYDATIETYCNALRSSRVTQTPRGLVYLAEWSPLRYASNSAFVCLMAAEKGIDTLKNRNWAKQQIHYMLGDSGRSYVVGYGENFPKQPHHRAASCPPRPQNCGTNALHSNKPNPHILEGALVGGPNAMDKYKDIRKLYKQTEVAMDYNAGFQGAIVALQYNVMFPDLKVSRKNEPWYKNKVKTTKGNNEETRLDTVPRGNYIKMNLFTTTNGKLRKDDTNLICWHSMNGSTPVRAICADDVKTCMCSWRVAGDKIDKIFKQGCERVSSLSSRHVMVNECKSFLHAHCPDKSESRNVHVYGNFCWCSGNLCNAKGNLISMPNESTLPSGITPTTFGSVQTHNNKIQKETESNFTLDQITVLLLIVFGVAILLIILFGMFYMYKDRFSRNLFINSPRKFIGRILSKGPVDFRGAEGIREHDLLCVSSDCDSDKRSQSSLSEEISDIFDLTCNCNANQLKGKGKFGLIYVGEDKASRPFCMKVSKEDIESKNAIKNEIKILQMLSHSNHSNIVKYIGNSTASNAIGFFMEYCTNGSLRGYLDQNVIDQMQFLSLTRDLTSAIAFLHSYDGTGPYKQCVAHRDICSSNMLLRDDLTLVAADFGTSEMLFEPNKISDINAAHVKAEGTPFYIAPEVLDLSIDLTHLSTSLKQADVYSMSLVMWEISSRCSYFYRPNTTIPPHTLPYQKDVSNTLELIDYVVCRKYRPKFSFLEKENGNKFSNIATSSNDSLAQSVVTVISQCWDKDEDTRLSASCVHERIASLRKKHLETIFIKQTIT